MTKIRPGRCWSWLVSIYKKCVAKQTQHGTWKTLDFTWDKKYVTNLNSSATPVDLDSTYPRGCISPIFHYIFIIPSLSHQSYSKKQHHYSKNLGHLFVSIAKKNYKGLVSTYPVGWGCKKILGVGEPAPAAPQQLWPGNKTTPGKFDSNLMWIEK